MNIIRWLMVDHSKQASSSVTDFFHISVLKYFPGRRGQLEALGKTLDIKCKGNWAAPLRKNVDKLRDINNNIS